MTQVTDPETHVIGYRYDAGGRATERVYPTETGIGIQYTYDDGDLITAIKWGETTLAQYGYDDLDRRTTAILGNGTITTYSYDLANQVTDITHGLANSQTLRYHYPDYDKVGNRKQMVVDETESHQYTYDKLYQITGVDYPSDPTVSYDYDQVGNREIVTVDGAGPITYTTNILNQYATVDSQSLTYDENGNLTSDGSLTYNYDSQNRLVSVYQGANEVASYTYDSAGRRHSKTIPNGPTTTYLYDAGSPANVLVEYENGSWVRAFVYGPGVDEPLCIVEPDGDIYYYHQDALGSVIALSDSTGALVERYSYDVFGKPEQASTVGNPYMFTGRRYDIESGLYYYRARMYHPGLGRFLQTDPIGYEDGVNWYAYCGNNPGNWIDPDGKFVTVIVGGIEITVGVWETVVAVVGLVEAHNLAVAMSRKGHGPFNPATGAYANRVANDVIRKIHRDLKPYEPGDPVPGWLTKSGGWIVSATGVGGLCYEIFEPEPHEGGGPVVDPTDPFPNLDPVTPGLEPGS